jgi:hypothetical protein
MKLDAEKQLRRLKDFQMRSVDYVFGRMYLDENPARRFLVADEVGLGKTMVARGVITKAIQHLRQNCDVSRVDIIYVCSNAAIAAQNLGRLNVLEDGKATKFATRLSLLALKVKNLNENEVNFVSFTPGTTFDLKSREGVAEERALIFYAFRDNPNLDREGLRKLLQGRVGDSSWNRDSNRWTVISDEEPAPDSQIVARYVQSVTSDSSLFNKLQKFAANYLNDEVSHDERYRLIGDLRARLAEVSLDALEPDLVILDEFQRFKHLLKSTEDQATASLAQRLFNWMPEMGQHPDDPPPRFLLLSATPYKMYTVQGEANDAHYKDFLQTMAFLMGNEGIEDLKRETRDYRNALQRHIIQELTHEDRRLGDARDALENRLRAYMVRTERVGHTKNRDGLLQENLARVPLKPEDLRNGVALDRLSHHTKSGDAIEYWKSAPYVLDFMKSYKLMRQLSELPPTPATAWALSKAQVLNARNVEQWETIEAGNPRARALVDLTLEDRQWQLLWIPPCMPYLQPQGAYSAGYPSKTLVFSSWSLVPDAIAALLSYEAERRVQTATGKAPYAYSETSKKTVSLLQYGVREDRYRGMGAFLLELPSPKLAALGDPLKLAVEAGGILKPAAVRKIVRARISEALDHTALRATEPYRDAKWYWAAVAAIEGQASLSADFHEQWVRDIHAGSKGFSEVAKRFFAVLVDGNIQLGQKPEDLLDRLTDLVLGAPGICALRALQRVCNGRSDLPILLGAGRVGDGMRSLYNQSDSMRILRADDVAKYWTLCAAHGVAGNLQALLDEHAHTLTESLGLQETAPDVRAEKISVAMRDGLTIRTANVFADHHELDYDGNMCTSETISFRTRFALRFGDLKNADNTVQRADAVRTAFNSPFRPFVLASTSVGQEGLDFHTWCHHVVHWNLPRNPVDMEQREGRVHRYKGLAVRRNVVASFGLAGLSAAGWNGNGDPWQLLFELAKGPNGEHSDLATFWVFEADENPTKVVRTVLLPQLSREADTYSDLKKSLALYRLAFGQPRQEELVEWLKNRADPEKIRNLRQWELRLGSSEAPHSPGSNTS